MAVRVDLKSAGVRELLRSPGVAAELKNRAERIRNAAGPGHEVTSFRGSNRARSTVRTTTVEAMISEQRHGTLTRAIGAGRG